jgi:hypothetical protein
VLYVSDEASVAQTDLVLFNYDIYIDVTPHSTTGAKVS